MGKLQIQSTKKSAAVTKNNEFFTTGMDCCMVPATAKAAVARTYNAKVACLVHIVVWSIGRGRYSNCDRLTEPAVSAVLYLYYILLCERQRKSSEKA